MLFRSHAFPRQHSHWTRLKPLPEEGVGLQIFKNAVRHAAAEHIFVDLVFDARRVRLSVRDDGRGFDSQATGNGSSGHFGLVGMRERAEQIGGTLSIHSEEGLGAEIVVDVPISG